jgi:hypothetical protein
MQHQIIAALFSLEEEDAWQRKRNGQISAELPRLQKFRASICESVRKLAANYGVTVIIAA